MKKQTLYILIFLTSVVSSAAQETTSTAVDAAKKQTLSLDERQIQILQQQWNQTDNVAGLGLNDVMRGSFTTLTGYRDQTQYHRVQQGQANTGLYFHTDRYDRFSDVLYVRGYFDFTMNQEQDRAWSDVYYPYNRNPYIYGNSIPKNYDMQDYRLGFDLYTKPIKGIMYGFKAQYRATDMSGQRDPRARAFLMDYKLNPSVVFNVDDKSSIGIDAYYRFEKEQVPDITTVQKDPTMDYATFTGLENAIIKIGGFQAFTRQFVSDFAGGALQYAFRNEKVKLLINGGVEMQWQQTLGDKKQSPGSYNSYRINGLVSLQIKNDRYIQDIRLNADIYSGGANQLYQELISVVDPINGRTTQEWSTIYEYKNRYVVQTKDIMACWKMYAVNNKGQYDWYVGADAAFESFANRYYLPKSSYGAARAKASVNGAVNVLSKNDHKLLIAANLDVTQSLNAYLNVESQNTVYNQILLPDLAYHQANTLAYNAKIQYTMPLKIGKAIMNGYVAVSGGQIFANNGKKGFNTSVTIGLLTF